ncbi:ABC transporter substrate-binding protein [Sedimentibacter sp.]|uniref:ABC transporter substrate-binding protein n=1 Tax=Sedimentibacter sp. TaxID=1960295 RepID=UPI0028A6BDDA|nr:ABC transporter substrate-binding protein [Sedimentibacter sp.]
MKKIIAVLTLVSVLLTSLSGCAEKVNEVGALSNDNDKKFRIGIVQAQNHPSLDEIREYIIIGLEEAGMKDSMEIIYKDAQNDPTNVTTIVNQFVGDNVDMIIPIATGAAQSALAATRDIPIVFAAVSYPVQAGLVEDMNKTDGNITGVSNAIAVEDIFRLSAELTPEVETYGFIYNPGEVNSASGIKRAKDYCDANGLKYVEANIANSGELHQTAQSLASKVDAIFVPNDNTVAVAMSVLAQEAINAGIPVYTGADSMVKDGGFATVGIDYKVLGRQTAAMAERILKGEKISDNPVEIISQYSRMVNTTTAKSLGIEISEDALKEIKEFE